MISYDDTMTVLQLRDAKLEQEGHHLEQADVMRVPVEDIQLVGINVRVTSVVGTAS